MSQAGSSVASNGREPGDKRLPDEEAAKSSLEMILRSGGLATAQLAHVPKARPLSPKRRPPQRPTPEWESTEEISHRDFSISYSDVYDDLIAEAVTLDSSSITPSIRDIPAPEGVQEHVFLVENLSRRAIHVLGEAFNVTSEFFEEHLLNSGYSGAQYNDPPARIWKIAGLTKSYALIQLFRPTYRLPPHLSGLDLENLLKGRLEFALGKSEHELEARTNIFRSEWVLQRDPGRKSGKSREIGLMERATIWMQNSENRHC
ncbi:hypothetical protein BDV29DRAFT_156472 [Aspergillus leporis]|uniref:Uncharacterized protein n=1 Tax=Aspergillus leporis TaxID=41062 RepID=A0A5N5X1V2_9EURO|nr:hypothetical protein BDV29DRAFT_156472 [Aspergillus leporis]